MSLLDLSFLLAGLLKKISQPKVYISPSSYFPQTLSVRGRDIETFIKDELEDCLTEFDVWPYIQSLRVLNDIGIDAQLNWADPDTPGSEFSVTFQGDEFCLSFSIPNSADMSAHETLKHCARNNLSHTPEASILQALSKCDPHDLIQAGPFFALKHPETRLRPNLHGMRFASLTLKTESLKNGVFGDVHDRAV